MMVKKAHFQRTVVPKTVDKTRLLVLEPDGANHQPWRERLSEYFQSQDGVIGAFLIPGADGKCAYVVRPELKMDAEWNAFQLKHPTLTAADLRKYLLDDIRRAEDQSGEDTEIYHKWYADTLSTLSDRQKDILRRATTWTNISTNRKPLELIELVSTSIVFRSDGLSATAQQDILHAKWLSATTQHQKESCDDYARRCKTVW